MPVPTLEDLARAKTNMDGFNSAMESEDPDVTFPDAAGGVFKSKGAIEAVAAEQLAEATTQAATATEQAAIATTQASIAVAALSFSPNRADVRLAATSAIAAHSYAAGVLTFSAVGSQSVDSAATDPADSILYVIGGTESGPYTVTTKGTGGIAEVWTRRADSDTGAELVGAVFAVTEGTSNTGNRYKVDQSSITLDTTPITFTSQPASVAAETAARTAGDSAIHAALDPIAEMFPSDADFDSELAGAETLERDSEGLVLSRRWQGLRYVYEPTTFVDLRADSATTVGTQTAPGGDQIVPGGDPLNDLDGIDKKVDASGRVLSEHRNFARHFYTPVEAGGERTEYRYDYDPALTGFAAVTTDRDGRIIGGTASGAGVSYDGYTDSTDYAAWSRNGGIFSFNKSTGAVAELTTGYVDFSPHIESSQTYVTFIRAFREGYQQLMFAPLAGGTAYPVLPSRTIVIYGDSIAHGAGGQVSWVDHLRGLMPDRMIIDLAQGGHTANEMYSRQGGRPSLFTVAGNQIPASGPVAVTARTVSPITVQGAGGGNQYIFGTLAGVFGVVQRAGDDSYTFTRGAAGSVVACPPATAFLPQTLDYDKAVNIFAPGQNNLTDPDQTIDGTADAVAYLKTLHKHYLVFAPEPGDSIASSAAGIGAAAAKAGLLADHPGRVFDLPALLTSLAVSPGDDAAVAAGAMPPTTLIDAIHLTTAAALAVAVAVHAELTDRSW